jgi:flavin-dependent dehydrogenase
MVHKIDTSIHKFTDLVSVEISIVGAGPGGLITGSILAKNGYDVHIFECNDEQKLGYDWRDDIDWRAFNYIGIPVSEILDESEHYVMMNYTFTSPDEKTEMTTNIPPESREWSIDRKILIRNLIRYAKKCGVIFHFGCIVQKPIIKEGKITGVITSQGSINANIIIDNAGLSTPIRTQMPEAYLMPKKLNRGEIFHVYRAYYNALYPITKFRVIMGFKGLRGIGWLNGAPECADILIGCIDPLNPNTITDMIKEIRDKNDSVGTELKSGGYITKIPIRRPLSMLVGDNYAIIGDAACMSSPINGSGVGQALKAGKILADTILKIPHSDSYSIERLWPYEVKFMQEIGSHLAQLEAIKYWMMTADLEDVNYTFKHGIISASDMERSIKGLPPNTGIIAILQKAIAGFSRLGVLLKLKGFLNLGSEVHSHYFNIPQSYNQQQVTEWAQKCEKIYATFVKMLKNN